VKGVSRAQAYLAKLAAGGMRMSSPLRLSNNEAENSPSAWTADSKAVLFASNRNGKWGIFKQAISGAPAEPVVTGLEFANLPCVSPDGSWVVYMEGFPEQSTKPNGFA
jgi:Tol biopolymer transport system component